MLTLDKIYHARYILSDTIRQTDIIYSPVFSAQTGCELFLKPEVLQITGSFKIRGAYYKISQLTDEEKAKGVIACSAGNHAQGVALASQKFGIRSIICMPEGAPISKVEATRSYGSEIILVPGVYDDAHAEAERLRDKYGYTFIHPFDDECVIAGQGTIGLEILDEMPDVDAIIVPVGGGGLISGIAYAVKSLNPNIKIYGVQSSGSPSMLASLSSGKIVALDSCSTIADGIAVKETSPINFNICKEYVDGIVTVNDDEIAASILSLIEKQKMISEGAGAAALAGVMFGKIPELKGKKVCCVLSGGNIDVTILSRIIYRGLLMSGRSCSLTLEIGDRPGQIRDVSSIIAACGGNITEILHLRSNEGMSVNDCYLKIEIETRDAEHIKMIKDKLLENGFKLVQN
ncbi:MAG: threonine ammonia-lyase [Clostridia bacterium]|nr:threonine ammonia-lyase [Clostridia bacterium]